jgi:predicted nucleic acid-binding protein
MATTAYDNEVFWQSSKTAQRLRRINRRLLRRPADPFDRVAVRKIAAVRQALARHGEPLEWEPRR